MSLIEKQFENKSLNLTIVSYIDNKQNVYFVGKDIASILGYVDTDQALRKHVNDYDKKTCPVETTGQVRQQIFINESGLYSLIFGSKLESAKNSKGG